MMRAYTPTSSDDDLGHFDLVVKVYFGNQHKDFPEVRPPQLVLLIWALASSCSSWHSSAVKVTSASTARQCGWRCDAAFLLTCLSSTGALLPLCCIEPVKASKGTGYSTLLLGPAHAAWGGCMCQCLARMVLRE